MQCIEMCENENQQVNSPWKRVCDFFRRLRNFFLPSDDDETDSGCGGGLFRRIVLFLRNLCSRPRPEERKSYPRLRLPSLELQWEYNMTHEHRGIALIFNHEKFSLANRTRRFGTSTDRDRLEKVLKSMKFDVEVHNDLKLTEIDLVLRKAALVDHTNHDCILIAILTHGEPGTLSSKDENYYIDGPPSFFTDENCPTLAGKPRIFLIQACRGEIKDAGYEIVASSGPQRAKRAVNYSATPDSTDVSPFSDMKLKRHDSGEYVNDSLHVPLITQPDFLIVRSTVPRYVSFRNVETGAWFIQEFCNVLEQCKQEINFLHILTFVNKLVGVRESNPDKFKQTISIASTLTKVLIFPQEDASGQRPDIYRHLTQ